MKKVLLTTVMTVLGILVLTGCSKDDDNEGETEPRTETESDKDDKTENYSQTDPSKDQKSKGIEAVDLGLPSGTKWANMNVGATKPEDYGGYYAWGETEEKDEYSWKTYIHCDGSQETCHDLGKTICGTEYDVAHVKWGGNWQMPSSEQIQELLNYCTSTSTTLNGVYGRLFKSLTNDGSIFLPAAGDSNSSDFYGFENYDYGFYWSGTLYPDDGRYAYGLYFGWQGVYLLYFPSHNGRTSGVPVRPVTK